MNNNILKIYTDGSCLGNPWPWGRAAILMYWDNSKTLEGADPDTTNNRMELMAVIQALKALKKKDLPVHIYTDSNYICDGITKYITKWQNNNRKTANKDDVKNQDLWKELLTLTQEHKPSWNWVKAHDQDMLNNLVDQLARKQAKSLSDKNS